MSLYHDERALFYAEKRREKKEAKCRAAQELKAKMTEALQKTGWNVKKSAELLNMEFKFFTGWMSVFNLSAKAHKKAIKRENNDN